MKMREAGDEHGRGWNLRRPKASATNRQMPEDGDFLSLKHVGLRVHVYHLSSAGGVRR